MPRLFLPSGGRTALRIRWYTWRKEGRQKPTIDSRQGRTRSRLQLRRLPNSRCGIPAPTQETHLQMKSHGTLTLVQSIYDHVHLALWATLAAFVAFFLAFIAPRLPEVTARAEALRIQEVAQENDGYCAKWQMGLGTKMHDQCHIGSSRASVEDSGPPCRPA